MAVTFNNFAALLAYINNYIVTNGAGDIDAVAVNNSLNGLLAFVEQSPINQAKARVEQGGGVITLSNPVTVVRSELPTSIGWTDNIYNQWVVINQLGQDVPLVDGLTYIDILGATKTSIPANSSINLYKVSNGQWVNSNV